MQECVRLCEAVEQYNEKYMLAENYPFSAPLLEMERLQAETGRSLGDHVHLTYHGWRVPEGKATSQVYKPQFVSMGAYAEIAGHGGGDFWMVYNFVNYIRTGETPFFDVYRGCCMSAVAILGWRSCLENGKVYAIPDFKNKAERDAWKDDNLTHFPAGNGNTTLPCALPWKK